MPSSPGDGAGRGVSTPDPLVVRRGPSRLSRLSFPATGSRPLWWPANPPAALPSAQLPPPRARRCPPCQIRSALARAILGHDGSVGSRAPVLCYANAALPRRHLFSTTRASITRWLQREEGRGKRKRDVTAGTVGGRGRGRVHRELLLPSPLVRGRGGWRWLRITVYGCRLGSHPEEISFASRSAPVHTTTDRRLGSTAEVRKGSREHWAPDA